MSGLLSGKIALIAGGACGQELAEVERVDVNVIGSFLGISSTDLIVDGGHTAQRSRLG